MSNSETESILKKDGDCNLTKDDLKNEQETKDRDAKEPKSVSFNKDVHVKRFGKGSNATSFQAVLWNFAISNLGLSSLNYAKKSVKI